MLDFVIVVVGILIAFQITEWNDQRREHALRTDYLIQLKDDLQTDIQEASDTADQAYERISAITGIFSATDLDPLLQEFFLEGQVISAPAYPELRYEYPYAHNHIISVVGLFGETRETFDTIINNGHFELLREPALVRQIQQYYALVEDVKSSDEAIVETFRRITEMRSRHGISLGGRTTVKALAIAAEADPQFAAELETYALHSIVQAGRMVETQSTAQALIEAIDHAN